jgi:putative SOS response-associated peptidase YedK
MRQATWLLNIFHWGLIPSWSDDPKIGNRLINARAETVATKPSFRSAFKNRRCLIPTSGFFEWKRSEKRKRRYLIGMRNREPFAFAGIWEHWMDQEEHTVETCAIITTTSNELVGTIHNRMSVILHPEDNSCWLDMDTPVDTLKTLLKPYPAELMEAHEVTGLVNNPHCDKPECILSVDTYI